MAFETTSFTVDVTGRFVCNSFDEVINGLNGGGAPFDVVVLGAGMAGGYCAEKIYRMGKEKGANLRILVLDAGSLFLTQHEQNFPGINPSTGPEAIVTSNSGPLHPDPGVQVAKQSEPGSPGLLHRWTIAVLGRLVPTTHDQPRSATMAR